MASSLWSDFGELVSLLDDVSKIPQERWKEHDPSGRSLLHMACSKGHLEAVRILHEFGLPIDHRDPNKQTPMECAIESDCEEIVAYLHIKGVQIRTLHLESAISYGSVNCARFLISNGISYTGVSYLYYSDYTPFTNLENCYRKCRKCVVALIGMKRKGTLLKWDRFLLHHLAICVWTTRADGKWV